jgi:hypothetical protein
MSALWDEATCRLVRKRQSRVGGTTLQDFAAAAASLRKRTLQIGEGVAEMIEHVAGEERLLTGASVEDRDLGGASADPGAEAGGVVKREILPS